MSTVTSLALSLSLLLLACNTPKEGDPEGNQAVDDQVSVPDVTWKRYFDTVNVGFTIGFDYPDTMEAMSIENARATLERGAGDEPSVEQMIWSVWMNDSSAFSIEGDLQGYLIGDKVDILQGPSDFEVDKMVGKRLLIRSRGGKDPTKELIYYSKHGTVFTIVNRRPTSLGFGRFMSSLSTRSIAQSTR